MFPLNGMRLQLKERLCLFLIRKHAGDLLRNFGHIFVRIFLCRHIGSIMTRVGSGNEYF